MAGSKQGLLGLVLGEAAPRDALLRGGQSCTGVFTQCHGDGHF